LPAFLTKGAGMFSGLMLSQYTADSLIVEQRILSMPASIGSIPAAADQEDFVSMGMNTAIKNDQILDNAYGVLGIEFMAAAQALDFREFTPGKGSQTAREVIRRHVAHLEIDRPLYNDHNAMQAHQTIEGREADLAEMAGQSDAARAEGQHEAHEATQRTRQHLCLTRGKRRSRIRAGPIHQFVAAQREQEASSTIQRTNSPKL